MDDAYQKTLDRATFIRGQGLNLVEKWGCELEQDLKRDRAMRTFFSEISDVRPPFNPADAIRGGRTNSVRLHYKAKQGERIDYLDFCRL